MRSHHLLIATGFLFIAACDESETLVSSTDTSNGDAGAVDTGPIYENCFNGVDDNEDLLIDCADSQCRSLDICREFECPDGRIGSQIGYPAFTESTEGTGNNLAGSCGGQGGEELALLWEAPADGDYWIDTRGRSYDTVLYILEGCGGDEIACNDDAANPPSLRSEILLTAEAEAEYLIVVDGYDVVNGPDGDEFQLNITPVLMPSEIGFCGDGRDNDEDGVSDCDDDDCVLFNACLPLEQLTEISSGVSHTCARSEDRSYCWGSSGSGELGVIDATPTARPVALQRSWSGLSAGSDFTCGLDDAAQTWCWGSGNWGRLLRPVEEGDAPEPILLPLPAAQQVAVGWNHNCAALTDGTVRCWGYNGSGQLGDGESGGLGSEAVEAVGVANARDVSAGAQSSCAVTDGGELWCWGGNGNGQIDASAEWTVPLPTRILDAVAATTVGGNHICALLENGQVQCRGANWSGQLGDGGTTERRQFATTAIENRVTSLDCGSGHCCAVDEFGGMWCWGANGWGQLGTGDNETALIPTRLEGHQLWTAVETGQNTTCAMTDESQAWCWGGNSSGQLGDATRTNSFSPRRVLRPTD
ncbi:MAG: alpha-tubulin suppressor-like RCC1 family protein [Bradymonadia bacterium]|jgi:alpha-tubulin suppressor-like RCC1 family protein